MALTPTVTKTAVTQRSISSWNVSVTLTVTDDDGPGFSQQYSTVYKQGTKVPRNIDDIRVEWLADMQARIDQYKTERSLFAHAKFDGMIAAINAGLVV